MEVQATDSSAPQETTSTAPSQDSTPEVSSQSPIEAKIAEKASQEAKDSVVQAQPTYTPNFKFSVMKKEHEIPEEFRTLITDAEKEKKVKEIFEKAHGLDFVKTERAKIQEDYKSYRSQTEPIMKLATKLSEQYQKGDLTSYFQTLGLPTDKVLKWAIQYAELQSLPEDQKRVYDQQRAAEQRAQMLEEQLNEQTQTHQQFLLQQRSNEIEHTLSNPQLSSFVQSFDQRNGEGAFRAELIARGQTYWHTQGIDVPPQHIAQEIMTKFGAPQSPQPVQSMNQVASGPKAPREVPTIPNTGNSNGSPAKKKVTSTDDLRKIYQSL